MKNMLTQKELTLLHDLLTLEECATKKARLYARTVTDMKLAEEFKKIADNHHARFNDLYNLL